MDSRQSGGSGSVSKSGSHVPVGKEWGVVAVTSEVAAMFDDVVTADLLPAMSCIEVAGLSKEELKKKMIFIIIKLMRDLSRTHIGKKERISHQNQRLHRKLDEIGFHLKKNVPKLLISLINTC